MKMIKQNGAGNSGTTARRWAVGLAMAVFAIVAKGETITFDEPGYVAGERPPSPWTDSYEAREGTAKVPFKVGADRGIGGSQCLEVPYTGFSEDEAVYLLPRPLTSADGAQRISVKYDPPGTPSNPNTRYAAYGGAWIGNGWKATASGANRGILFDLDAGAYKIWVPPGYTLLAGFVPSTGENYHELIFDINAAWDTITYTVVFPDGTSASRSSPWNGTPIDKVWLGPANREASPAATYDDLVIGTGGQPPTITEDPQPFTLAMMGGPAEFSVAVENEEEVRFQWRFNDSPIEDATNRTYVIPAVSPSHVGAYTVEVSNDDDSVTSEPSILSVASVQAVPSTEITLHGPVGAQYRIDVAEALSDPSGWTTWTNFTLSASSQTVADTDANGASQRFYHIQQVKN